MRRLVLLVILLFGLFAITPKLFAEGVANRVIAVVGDQIILQSALQEAVDFVRMMNQSSAPDSVLYEQVLDEMIKNDLLLEQAKKETVDVARSEIEDEVDKNVTQLKQKFQSDKEYQDALKKEGITERALRDRYRDDIRRRLISQRLLAKEGLTNISVTPTEIRQFYNQHKDSIAHQPGQIAIAHILFIIKPSPTEEAAAQKKITEIYDIIARGGDFEQVAKSFSEDKVTKDRGGYLGNVTADMLQPEVQAAISNLKAGEVSQPFRSRNSYEIIKVLSRKSDKIELSHLMVSVALTRADSSQVKKTALKVRGMFTKGASFDSLAKIYSDDPMTKDSGGYLGEFLLTGLQEPFRSAIEKLPVGAVTEPVLSEHGYHLIKILTRQEDKLLTLPEMQDQIRNYLFDQQLKSKLDDYLTKLAARTYITKF